MDATEWLEKKVHGFGDLPQADRDAIRDFGLLWALFEQKVLDNEGSAKAIVDATVALAKDGRLHMKPFAPALAYFRKRYVEDGQFNEHHESLLLRKNDRPALVEAVLTGRTDDPAELAAGVLIIIFRFRNNFAHGMKWAYGIRGQRENFERSNTVLMAVMEMWGLDH